ncbi:MAG: hypothetical protein HKP37_08080 [Boseongicola sp.]|nr:hypothetical protein [Boseongicola sp.]NNL18680.1 hypothetical protein [Boseongicola sp.]
MLAIANALEETYIGKYEGRMIGAASAVAILETIVTRWKEHVVVRCGDDKEMLGHFENIVALLKEDLLKRTFIKTAPTNEC